jgi:hypothetical protein
MYRELNALIDDLTPEERAYYFNTRFQKLATEIQSKWWVPWTGRTVGEMFIAGCKAAEWAMDKVRNEGSRVKDHFTVKPRMTARDDEVVRLRDQEGLAWKEITKRIRANPDWACGRKGKPVSTRALVVAYSRRKKAADC